MLSAALRILATTALGGAAGFFGGLFGVGGGAIAIPLLGLLYHLDQQTAQGTTLVMVVPNVLLGFWRYRRRVGIDLRIAGALAISAMASTYPAARFATALDPRGLRLAFAAFLVILAAIIAYRTRRGSSRQPDRDPLTWGWSVPLGIVGGIVSGLVRVGGALIVPPALTAFFRFRQRRPGPWARPCRAGLGHRARGLCWRRTGRLALGDPAGCRWCGRDLGRGRLRP